MDTDPDRPKGTHPIKRLLRALRLHSHQSADSPYSKRAEEHWSRVGFQEFSIRYRKNSCSVRNVSDHNQRAHERQDLEGNLFLTYKKAPDTDDLYDPSLIGVTYNEKNRSAKRTCVGLDLLLFHSVRVLVLNISIRELKYYQ